MDETILFKAEKHYIIYIILFFIFLIWIIINILVYKLFWFNINTNIINILLLCFNIIIIYNMWINNELNNIVIIGDKLIYIKNINLIEKEEIKINISDIKDIKYEKKWIFENMLDYWKIKINDEQIKISFINKPKKIIKNLEKIIKK